MLKYLIGDFMKIGIPRAFLYYKYHYLWESFFENLGLEYIISPYTNKEIIRNGTSYAIDEACLSSKIYLGHIEYLIGKCDYIIVPRVFGYGEDGTVCTKFQAIYDVVNNTFRDRNIKILYYNISPKEIVNEFRAFLKMGKFLGFKKSVIARAYLLAKHAEKTHQILDIEIQKKLFEKDGIKIMIVGHQYNIYDRFIGEHTISYLKSIGVIPIIADLCDKKEAMLASKNISETLPWAFNKELVGAIALYKDMIDGIILISAFPCGPDSLVNEMIIRRIKDKPIINLIMDGQEGQAGIETRLESFIDIIKIKRDDQNGKM
jgi:predicted nucleotide-binding protein (sugar kinase/HSP70/actin superfamily)